MPPKNPAPTPTKTTSPQPNPKTPPRIPPRRIQQRRIQEPRIQERKRRKPKNPQRRNDRARILRPSEIHFLRWSQLEGSDAVPPGLRKFGTAPGRRPGLLQLQRLQISSEIRAQFRILQRQLHRRLQKSQLVPGVVRNSFVDVRPKALLLRQHAQAVGELNLIACAGISQ